MTMTNELEWINTHGRALRVALEAPVTDHRYLAVQAEEFTRRLCRRHHLQPARTEEKVRDMLHRLLPEWLQAHGTWESFVKEVLYSVSVAEDEQFALPAVALDESRGGVTDPPAPESHDLGKIAEDAAKSVTRDFLQMLSEFNAAHARGASPVYSMIKAAPERHSALLALFIILEPELFEEFIAEFGGTTFRVPSVEELATFRRDQEILSAKHQGLTNERIAKKTGLSTSRVTQILKDQRRHRRSDPDLDAALIRAMNRWARISQHATVKKRLR
jgi:hypothetical protein